MADLKAKKLEITSGEILNDLSEMIDNLRISSARFIPLKSGNENRSSSDEYSKIEVPEYSMQYTGLM